MNTNPIEDNLVTALGALSAEHSVSALTARYMLSLALILFYREESVEKTMCSAYQRCVLSGLRPIRMVREEHVGGVSNIVCVNLNCSTWVVVVLSLAEIATFPCSLRRWVVCSMLYPIGRR